MAKKNFTIQMASVMHKLIQIHFTHSLLSFAEGHRPFTWQQWLSLIDLLVVARNSNSAKKLYLLTPMYKIHFSFVPNLLSNSLMPIFKN